MSKNTIYVDEEWKKVLIQIYELHQISKAYYLKCEEYAEDLESILQPIKELRDAYDHFVRILSPTADDKFKLQNLKSVLSHEYRAFFDTLDYFCLILREKIYNEKEVLGEEILRRNVKNYRNIQKDVVWCCNEIADIRAQKDISCLEDTVMRYQEVAIKLEDCYNQIMGLG